MSQATIADKIEAHIDRLIESWRLAVRDDPRIESDATLSEPELVDHVPAIIEEICELIRDGEKPSVRNSHEARVNVYTRFHQGYRGRDLIRELSLLRITLLDYLMEISSDEPSGIDPKDRHDAATTLNLYLDEEMQYAISVYSSPPSGSQEESTGGDKAAP
jgi:hypothetical protein